MGGESGSALIFGWCIDYEIIQEYCIDNKAGSCDGNYVEEEM